MRRGRVLAAVAVAVVAAVIPSSAGHAVTTGCGSGELSSVGNVRGGPHYDMGTPTFIDIWVSPSGDDTNSGASPSAPLATVQEAWRRIPAGTLTAAYRIRLMSGTYTGQAPFLEDRHGSRAYPILIQSDGAEAGRDDTVFDGTIDVAYSDFVYILDLTVQPSSSPNDAIHLQHGDHFLLRDLMVSAFDASGARSSYDLVKVNQVTHAFVEDSDLAGATDNALDFMAVQCGHIIANDIHAADDWCAYAKGGSAYLRVEANRLFDCGGGFTAGQGSGFQFDVPAQIHYEAYDVKVLNNVVHDVARAAFSAQGAYDVLISYNTAFRAGQGYDHLLAAEPGERTCDPGDAQERAVCDSNVTAGGWGPTSASPTDQIIYIPNKHVFIYNNVLWNDQQATDQQLRIPGPWSNPPGFGAPTTVLSDDDLRLAGNIIANGTSDEPYATDGGCLDTHPTCSPAVFFSANQVNTMTPQLVDPANGDFHPTPGGNLAQASATPIPNFSWADAPTTPSVPQGNLDNSNPRNFDGQDRGTAPHPGAF
jgi:hypothetical protein